MDVRPPTGAEASELIEEAKAIFDAHATMSLAVCGPEGPWIAKVFFVEDEPEPGRLDMCCALLMTSRKLATLRDYPAVAFLVASDRPDRWIQGVGAAAVVEDDADADAVRKRLAEKSAEAGPFLDAVESRAVRIQVRQLRLTDTSKSPPIAEFRFA